MRSLIFICLTWTLALAAPGDPAREEAIHRAEHLSALLLSPYCKGKTLAACTSRSAMELRVEIRSMALSGRTDDEIVETLQARFPNFDLRNPPQPWITFAAPFVPFVIGGGLLFWLFWRWRRRSEPREAPVREGELEADERLARLRARVRDDS